MTDDRYISSKLKYFLEKLGLKNVPYSMKFPSWHGRFRERMMKFEVMKELKTYEQEIKSRKTKSRS